MNDTSDLSEKNALVESVTNRVDSVKGNKFGKCDVRLSIGIEICGVTLHRQGDKIWVGFPAAEFLTSDHQKRFVNVFKFSDGVRAQLEYEILSALNLTEPRLV